MASFLKKVGKVAKKVGRIGLRVGSLNPGTSLASALGSAALGKGNILKGTGKILGQNAAGAAAIGAAYFGGKGIGAAGAKLFGGGAGAAAAGGMSGANGMPGGPSMGYGGNTAAAGRSVPAWRQAARAILSGGKPLTFKNVAGGGRGGNILKTAAAAGLTAAGLKEALARRRLQNRMLEQTTGIGDELATRGRSLTAGADKLRIPAESRMAALLAEGSRPTVDPRGFADTLNPYRRRFAGGR